MPLNVTIYSALGLRNGAMAQAPMLTTSTPSQVVALGAQSTAITGPCLACLIADEAQRIALVGASAYVAPAADGIKLLAGIERYYDIPKGTWFLNVVAG